MPDGWFSDAQATLLRYKMPYDWLEVMGKKTELEKTVRRLCGTFHRPQPPSRPGPPALHPPDSCL